MAAFELGEGDGGAIMLDVDRLVESRLLIQANSGGGKSWAIRRILEQTFGQIQQLVIDPEDEFHTLRGKYDYVLAGRDGGDCPADPRSAALLAERFLELGVSAIFGIFELKAHERILFVRRFLEGLINARKELRHPVLIVIDEAHMFCPEKGKAESAAAVIDLMSRGRKRGLCGILATQRISRLNKDAAADANNKLIGRASLDIDMRRAAEELGFSRREDQQGLRHLKPGEFYSFGPALTENVIRFKVGGVQTTHPEAGARSAPPPPAPARLKAVLAKLADVPADHAASEKTEADFKTEIRSLKGQLAATKRTPGIVNKADIDGAYDKGFAAGQNSVPDHSADLRKRLDKIAKLVGGEPSVTVRKASASTARPKLNGAVATPGFTKKTGGKWRMIEALVSRYPAKFTKAQWGTLSHMKHTGGSFNTYVSALRTEGCLTEAGGFYQASESAMDQYGQDVTRPETAEEVRAHWLTVIGAPARLLQVLIDWHDTPISKEDLAERVGMTVTGGSFNTYLSKLNSNQLIEKGPDGIMAAAILFEEPA